MAERLAETEMAGSPLVVEKQCRDYTLYIYTVHFCLFWREWYSV